VTPLEKAHLIDSIYNSPGWIQVFQPLLEEKHRTNTIALRNPDLARKAKLPDDYIRGVLDTVEWLMTVPRQAAEVDRNVGVQDEMHEVQARKDAARAFLGWGSGEIIGDE